MKTRMWIVETDSYGATDRKFSVDDPQHIPRVGELVDGDKAGGWVSHVQWNYPSATASSALATVYVYLKDKK